MAVKEFYEAIEVDPADVLKRFGGSEAMLEKFLKKFLADGTFAQLSEALAAGDQELTFRAAHTLKGLAGNFDLLKLQSLAAKIVERYRANDFDAIPALFAQTKECYEFTVASLNRFLC